VYALDDGPEVPRAAGGSRTGLPIQHKAIPLWALRLLVAALLLPALVVLGDGLARVRRRREPVGRWVLWALACGLPFLACAVFAILLGRLHAIPAPRPPVSPAALPFDTRALEAVLASALVLVLAWLGWPAAMRRLGLPVRPHADAAALGMLLVLGGLATLVWAFDPLAALLLVPALHLWLVLAETGTDWGDAHSARIPNSANAKGARPPASVAVAQTAAGRGGLGVRGNRIRALTLVMLGVVPLALLVAFYAGQLDLDLGGVAHTALLLLAGGRIGVGGAVMWSVACGCLAAALLVALAPSGAGEEGVGGPEDGIAAHEAITIRGPLSYAGPGSLGGTESALRR
jgi:hypothetical protein